MLALNFYFAISAVNYNSQLGSHESESSLSQHKAFNYVILPFKLRYLSNCLQETFQTLSESPKGSSHSSSLLNPFLLLTFSCAWTELPGPQIFSDTTHIPYWKGVFFSWLFCQFPVEHWTIAQMPLFLHHPHASRRNRSAWGSQDFMSYILLYVHYLALVISSCFFISVFGCYLCDCFFHL